MNEALYNEQEIKIALEEKGIHIVGYAIFKVPASPAEEGEYIGKTPVFEQALQAIEKAKKNGEILFLKAICDDGIYRTIL